MHTFQPSGLSFNFYLDNLSLDCYKFFENDMKKSANWFLGFLTRNLYWICQSNHNHLRITRAIKSLRLIHSNEEAESFKKNIMNLIQGNENKINPISLEFWNKS